MNIKQIEYFIEVAKRQNYTAAAKHLYISQSAITKQIFLLEEELETEPFIRNNKGVKLTRAGEIFLKDALDIISKIEKSQQKIKNFKMGAIGFLNIGYVNGLERTNMLLAIQRFYQQYTQCCVEYEGHTSYILKKRLSNDKLDIIMTHRLLNDNAYINEKIFQSQIMVFVARDTELASKKYFEKEELPSLKLIANTTDISNENITPKTIDQLLLQIIGGQGATILPDYAIQYTQFQNYLIGIPVKGMYETTYAVYKKENQNPLIYKFIELLKNSF